MNAEVLKGNAACRIKARAVDIAAFRVADNYRTACIDRIGKAFFEFLKTELAGRIKRIRLEVGEDNLGAIKLYKNIGFEFLDYRQMVIDKDF